MKRKEILYDALSGISEDKAADAYEYADAKKKNTVLRNILYGAGIAAIFCSFIVLSFVLLKISGPKNVPDETNNAAASGSVITDEINTIETAAETEEQTEAVTETAESMEEKRYTNHAENTPIENPSIERLYQTEPYKNFLPSYIPDELVYNWAQRWIPGEYLQADGAYFKQIERIVMYFSTDARGNTENSLNIIMRHRGSPTRPSADEISVSCIERGEYSAGPGDDIVPGTVYSLTFNADGWELTYQYQHLCTEEELLTPQQLFDIVTSSRYFKDHPLSVD